MQYEECTVQNLGTNKKVIIVQPQTRYWSPVERTLKLFLTFFPKEKIQTQKTGRSFVPVPFSVFLRGRFSNFFWFNRTSKIGAVKGVSAEKPRTESFIPFRRNGTKTQNRDPPSGRLPTKVLWVTDALGGCLPAVRPEIYWKQT